jgi:serine/threonine protein kinase
MTQQPQRTPAVSAPSGVPQAADRRTNDTVGLEAGAARLGDRNSPESLPLSPAQRLEKLWQQGQRPDVHQFLAGAGAVAPAELAAVLAIDQWQRWQAGDGVPAEDYLARYPALAAEAALALELVYGEFLVREQLGQAPTAEDYLRRFPRYADRLQEQLQLHSALERSTGPPPPRPRLATRESGACLSQAATLSVAAPPMALSNRFDDYELLEEVARGGMGVVYKARQVSLDRIVALKMILHQGPMPADVVQRFLREAQAAAALDHPNIVAVYASGQHEGLRFFTMAYVEGENLRETVKRRGLPAPGEAAALLRGVADAVAFAHQHGIIHRDLKPENVLIDRQGRPRVTDFGLAYFREAPVGAERLTQPGQVMGTPAFMSPEQALGKPEALGPTMDVYSLGGILYFLLTGQAPFRGRTATEVLSQVLSAAPTPPRQINPRADARLEAICLRCLTKDPARRYPSAAALAAALAAVGAEAPAQPKEGRPEAAGGWSRRTLVGLAAVTLVAAAAAVWLLDPPWWPGSTPPDHGTPTRSAPPLAAQLQPPKDLRKDFDLAVSVVQKQLGSDGFRALRPAADGLLWLREGAEVKIRVKVARAAFVGIWSVSTDGTVIQLLPNDWEKDHHFRSNEERRVPATGAVDFVVQKSARLEWLWVRASTRPWELRSGPRTGPFPFFKKKQDVVRWRARQERLIVLRPVGTLSEAVVKYRVGPP